MSFDVGEPLLLLGSVNDWQIDAARREHSLAPLDSGSARSQESVLQVAVPKEGLEFQIISAIHTWEWRLHPSSERRCVLRRDFPEYMPVTLSRGADSEAAHGLNFLVNAPPGRLVDVRVLLSERFGICVWYSHSTVGLTTQEAPSQPLAAPKPERSGPEPEQRQVKRTAERVGAFTAFKEKNQPQAMDAFKRGGTPMAPRTKTRSTPGAFSRAVANPEAGLFGTAPKSLKPKTKRPPRRVVFLTVEATKELLEALRLVCSHQSFRRELDELRRRDLGAFKKRQAMAALLAKWWKEQIRESGFSIDEHGFPQMLDAVRAHRNSAGVDIVSREVERLLGFAPGSFFLCKGVETAAAEAGEPAAADGASAEEDEAARLAARQQAAAAAERRAAKLAELAAEEDRKRRQATAPAAAAQPAERPAAPAARSRFPAAPVPGAAAEVPVLEADASGNGAATEWRVWLVVGGAGKGGIIVREEADLKSPELPRLQKGSKVRELERRGNRLHFQLVQGEGPEFGWANVTLNEKTLLKYVERKS